MPRGTWSVDLELAAIANRTVRLVEDVGSVTAPTARSTLKAPSFNGKGKVELLIKRFQEVAEENGCMDQVYLISSLDNKNIQYHLLAADT